jgi:CO/xanthine dehydrogenase FAD-binding subunit
MAKNQDPVRVSSPHTLRDALSLLKEYPGIRLIAGGTDIMQKLKDPAHGPPPASLISLSGIDELSKIRRKENTIEIGAAVPLERIISLGGNVVPPLLVTVLSRIANRAVRNLATLGGGIALASPFSDALLPLLLFDARCEVRRFTGHSWVPLARLVKSPWKSGLDPFEILAGVSLPVPQWNVRDYVKLDIVSQPELSLLKFAGLAKVYKATVSDFRVIWGGVDPLALRNREIEAMVIGSKIPVPARLCEQFGARVRELIDQAPPSFLPEKYHRRSAARLALAFLDQVSSYREM